jgi:hypothetical protein
MLARWRPVAGFAERTDETFDVDTSPWCRVEGALV